MSRILSIAGGLLAGSLANRERREEREAREQREREQQEAAQEQKRRRALEEATQLLELQRTPGVVVEDAAPHDAMDAASMAGGAFGVAMPRSPLGAASVELAGARRRIGYDPAKDSERTGQAQRAQANQADHAWLATQDPEAFGAFNPGVDYTEARARWSGAKKDRAARGADDARQNARDARERERERREALEEEATGAVRLWVQGGNSDPEAIDAAVKRSYPQLPYGRRAAIIAEALKPPTTRGGSSVRRPATGGAPRPALAGTPRPAPGGPPPKKSEDERIEELLGQGKSDEEIDAILTAEGY